MSDSLKTTVIVSFRELTISTKARAARRGGAAAAGAAEASRGGRSRCPTLLDPEPAVLEPEPLEPLEPPLTASPGEMLCTETTVPGRRGVQMGSRCRVVLGGLDFPAPPAPARRCPGRRDVGGDSDLGAPRRARARAAEPVSCRSRSEPLLEPVDPASRWIPSRSGGPADPAARSYRSSPSVRSWSSDRRSASSLPSSRSGSVAVPRRPSGRRHRGWRAHRVAALRSTCGRRGVVPEVDRRRSAADRRRTRRSPSTGVRLRSRSSRWSRTRSWSSAVDQALPGGLQRRPCASIDGRAVPTVGVQRRPAAGPWTTYSPALTTYAWSVPLVWKLPSSSIPARRCPSR